MGYFPSISRKNSQVKGRNDTVSGWDDIWDDIFDAIGGQDPYESHGFDPVAGSRILDDDTLEVYAAFPAGVREEDIRVAYEPADTQIKVRYQGAQQYDFSFKEHDPVRMQDWEMNNGVLSVYLDMK